MQIYILPINENLVHETSKDPFLIMTARVIFISDETGVKG